MQCGICYMRGRNAKAIVIMTVDLLWYFLLSPSFPLANGNRLTALISHVGYNVRQKKNCRVNDQK